MTDSTDLQSLPAHLVDWMRASLANSQCHSLVLGARCASRIHTISRRVADYLNEFDHEGDCQWRAVDVETVRQIAGDPSCRNLLLTGSETGSASPSVYSDFDRVQRRLATLGGIILEGQCGLDATTDIEKAFHVCLCTEQPLGHADYHMWVNPRLVPLESLVSVIADSFLNWSCQRGRVSHPKPGSASQSGSAGPEFAI